MADIKESVEDLKLPADATPFERTLYATVKKDMAILLAEVERLRAGFAAEVEVKAAVAAEREACAALSETYIQTHNVHVGPGGDCGQGCYGIAEEIAAAIRARTQSPANNHP